MRRWKAMAITAEWMSVILTGVGIICTLVVALLTMIWGELRNMRKEMSDANARIGVVETILTMLPCQKSGNCAIGERE
jgi:hypothetical protein